MTLDEEARERLHRLADAHPEETPSALAARLGVDAVGVRPATVYEAAADALSGGDR